MKKVNIREALLDMDKQTYCQYDLYTLYEACNLQECDKKEIAKMISDDKSPEDIYDKLVDKFSDSVTTTDDDDISDVKESFGDDLIDSQYQDDTSDGHWSWDYDDDELANIYGGDTKYDNHPDGLDIDEYDQFEECLSESDKTDTFVTPEGKELKSSHFVKLFKDAVKTGAWHKKFGKQGELTRVEIENANKRENRLRMQLAELFGYSQEEIDAIEEEALSEPITADYLEESQNTGLHKGNSITEDTSNRTSTDFSWSTDWCDCGAKDAFPHMMFATDAETVFWDGPYGYRLRGEVFAENPNVFHAYVMRYNSKSEYELHGQGGKTIAEKEYIDSLEAAKAFIEDWFKNSFDSYVNKRNESLTEGLSPKEGDRVRMDHYSKLNNGQEGTITGRIGELCWVTWDDGTKSKEIKGYLTVIERDGTVVNESATDPRYYKMVEYTYDGDNVSDYLGHVRVRTNSDKVALRAAEKYAMSKHPEDNPGHFKIVDDNYTNVDVIDSDGDYLTTLESVDESKSIKEDVEVIYQKGNKKIVKDGYGYAIDDGINANRFYVTDDGKPKFDDGCNSKFWIDKVNSLIKAGKLTSRKNESKSIKESTKKLNLKEDYENLPEGYDWDDGTSDTAYLEYNRNTHIWTASSNKKTFTGFKTPEEAAAKLRNYMHKHTQGYDNTYIPAFEIDNDSNETISYISPIYFGNYIDEEYGYDFSDDEDYFDPEDYEGNDSYSNTKGSTSVNATTKQNTKWLLDSNTGILNISGSGRMDGHISTPDNQYVKSINIENGITSIHDVAFSGCINLTSINIPDGVTRIGYGAFESCSRLTSITLPDSVTSIEQASFAYCSSLTSITIPDSVTSIGKDAFYDCDNLVIRTSKGSYADKYAKENGIPVKYINRKNESKSIKESSLVDKKVSTLGKRGKPMYFTADQLEDAKSKYPEYDFEETTIEYSLPAEQKAYIARRKTNESKSIKEGTFHWSDNKAAYEAIKVKNALKKAFNTHVFQDDSQNLYIPFNFWGRKDAEKAGVTIDTVGKFLNSIGYKYTGRNEDDEDVYNYLKDDVRIELYEVDYNRYAIHLDFDSEVDDKLDIDTTSFSSYVNTDDVDAVQDLLLDIVDGRVKTLGDISISEEDVKNIKRLCGRTLDMGTYDFAGYSDDIVDKIDDYFAMKQYQELHNKHVAESKSIKEDINDSDEVLTFKRDVNLANDADEIQLLIYELSDGVAEDTAQQAFNENEFNDLETLKSAVITAIDLYLEDNEWLGESKSIKKSSNTMIYLFPELTDEDLDMLKAYGLQLLGINYGAYGDEENWVVRGQEKALRRYADKYLGYELHPDYLYDEEDFAGDIIKESIKVGDNVKVSTPLKKVETAVEKLGGRVINTEPENNLVEICAPSETLDDEWISQLKSEIDNIDSIDSVDIDEQTFYKYQRDTYSGKWEHIPYDGYNVFISPTHNRNIPSKELSKETTLDEGIDGWDNRTGVIKRIDKYLYDNPEAIPPKGYIQPGSRAYDDAVSRYGDYVTTPFGNISTDDLMQYARDNKLLDESKYTSNLIGPDSLLMNAEEAYFDDNLGDFVADTLNDGSATEEELLAVTEKSSFIEYDDMLNAIDYAKSLNESFDISWNGSKIATSANKNLCESIVKKALKASSTPDLVIESAGKNVTNKFIRSIVESQDIREESIEDTSIEDIDKFVAEVKEKFPGSEAIYDGDTNTIKITLDNVQKENLTEDSIESDELETAAQKISSANTSINSSKLPAIFRLVKFEPDTLNLDYGGGKFDNAAEYLAQQNVTNLVYDPYNRSTQHNAEVLQKVRENGGADTITISNVLNVIAEPEARLTVLRNAKKLVKPGGNVYITVYEGNKSGEGTETKSGYQLNKSTADYIDEIASVFSTVNRKGKLIIAK